MRRLKFCIWFLVVILASMLVNLSFAEQKSITLPKGTTVEKLGSGHFRFKLPNGRVVEVGEFDPKTGNFGYCRIDDEPTWKPEKGQLRGQAKSKPVKLPPGTEFVLIDDEPTWVKRASKVPKSDYIMIDDEPTWLPATIQFQSEEKGSRGLSPQPDPPGRQLKK